VLCEAATVPVLVGYSYQGDSGHYVPWMLALTELCSC